MLCHVLLGTSTRWMADLGHNKGKARPGFHFGTNGSAMQKATSRGEEAWLEESKSAFPRFGGYAKSNLRWQRLPCQESLKRIEVQICFKLCQTAF